MCVVLLIKWCREAIQEPLKERKHALIASQKRMTKHVKCLFDRQSSSLFYEMFLFYSIKSMVWHFKGIVHPTMEIMSSFSHTCVVLMLYAPLFFSDHKRRFKKSPLCACLYNWNQHQAFKKDASPAIFSNSAGTWQGLVRSKLETNGQVRIVH